MCSFWVGLLFEFSSSPGGNGSKRGRRAARAFSCTWNWRGCESRRADFSTPVFALLSDKATRARGTPANRASVCKVQAEVRVFSHRPCGRAGGRGTINTHGSPALMERYGSHGHVVAEVCHRPFPACHGWEGTLSIIPENTRVMQPSRPADTRWPVLAVGGRRYHQGSRGQEPMALSQMKFLEENQSWGGGGTVILDV